MESLVVFTDLGARHVVGHKLRFHHNRRLKIVRHPDLSHVHKVPAMFWKLSPNGQIVEMTRDEKVEILKKRIAAKRHKDTHAILYPMLEKFFILMIAASLGFLIYKFRFLGKF